MLLDGTKVYPRTNVLKGQAVVIESGMFLTNADCGPRGYLEGGLQVGCKI